MVCVPQQQSLMHTDGSRRSLGASPTWLHPPSFSPRFLFLEDKLCRGSSSSSTSRGLRRTTWRRLLTGLDGQFQDNLKNRCSHLTMCERLGVSHTADHQPVYTSSLESSWASRFDNWSTPVWTLLSFCLHPVEGPHWCAAAKLLQVGCSLGRPSTTSPKRLPPRLSSPLLCLISCKNSHQATPR